MLGGFEIALLARMVLSWIPSDSVEKLYDFAFTVTEPFVAFVRAVIFRVSGDEDDDDLQFDISTTVTYFVIFIIRLLVSLSI